MRSFSRGPRPTSPASPLPAIPFSGLHDGSAEREYEEEARTHPQKRKGRTKAALSLARRSYAVLVASLLSSVFAPPPGACRAFPFPLSIFPLRLGQSSPQSQVSGNRNDSSKAAIPEQTKVSGFFMDVEFDRAKMSHRVMSGRGACHPNRHHVTPGDSQNCCLGPSSELRRTVGLIGALRFRP